MKKMLFFAMLIVMTATTSSALASELRAHVLRLVPGDDPKLKLEAYVKEKNLKAVVVVSAVGSLTKAVLRYANESKTTTLTGFFEIVSLSGTLGSTSGSHIHMSISDKEGKTLGGHLVDGSKIYTTLEVALAEVTEVEFKREHDPLSTYNELKVYPAVPSKN